MKKLLFSLLFLCFIGILACDSYVKECTYEVYQKGERVPTYYKHYDSLSKTCSDFTKDGNLYILINVKKIKYKDILK